MSSSEKTKFNDNSLSEIINLSADAILSIDKNKHIISFNLAAEKMFGYNQDEIIGQSLKILMPLSMRPLHDGFIENFEKSEQGSHYMGQQQTVRGLMKNGEELFLDISIQRHAKDSEIAYSAICRDISSRLQILNENKESAEKFRTLFNSSSQFVIIMDVEGIILDINETALKSLKDKASDYIGRNLSDCNFWLTESDRKIISQAIKSIKTDSISYHMASILGQFNRENIYSFTMKNLSRSKKTGDFVIVEGLDITDRVRANKLLAKSEDRLSRAQKIAEIGSWEWNIPSNKLTWSDEVYNIFGVSKKEFGASYDALLEFVHPVDREKFEEQMKQTLNHNHPFSITHRIICPDGREKVVHEIGEVLRISDGTPLKMTGTVQDITENWNKTHDLIADKKKAEQANFAKSQFLATMSHEIRNPLNVIIGYSSLISEEVKGPLGDVAYKGYAQDIKNSGDILLSLIDNILDVSKIDLESIEPHYDYFDFSKFIDHCFELELAKATDKQINIEKTIPKNMPDIYLDEDLCKQIFINLINNSIKHTGDGGMVSIVVNKEEEEVVISVIDTGIGMGKEEVKSIFDPFNHVASANLSKKYGVGIGLTIVKKLTELQGGRISVKSQKGEGTTFTIAFPIKLPEK